MMRVWGVSRGLTSLILEIGTIYVALNLRGQGIISIGVIVLLQSYVLQLIDELGNMSNAFRAFFRCTAEIGEIVEIVDTPHSVVDKTDKKLKVSEGTITFEDVDFSYDGKNKVFDNLSLHIKPGERI
ncbi:MAG: hypothetical protein LBD11_08565 [Candidatus Peribacteria bacterium]|jgi:ABC-type multidrug transport system fused ATPase/permease subunit|nr:hypothetical protein [Candidatus Peribacteria bacterium]